MTISMYLSIGSLLLGLLAWALPIVAAVIRAKGAALTLASLSACAVSVCMQIYEIKNRVHMGDFSAIIDTIDTLSWVCVVLLAVTVLLNVFALWRSRR